MSFNFIIDSESHNNDLELVINPTEHNKIARISIDEDGTKKYYQRKTSPIGEIQQESSIDKPSSAANHESSYKNIVIIIGSLSTLAFTYGLYIFYPKLIKLIELNTNLNSNKNKLKYFEGHYESLEKLLIPKKINHKFINKYLKHLVLIDGLEVFLENNGYLNKLTRSDLSIVHKEVINQFASIILKISEDIHLIETRAIKTFEEIIFSPFTGLIPVSTLGILGAVYAYDSDDSCNFI